MVPNSHEFVYLNMVTGIFASLTSDDLYRRAKLFTSVGIIYLLYIFSYLAFVLISDGNFTNFNLEILLMFTLNCFATLFVQPLTYIFEKLFGLVSDASLLELTDTNNKILRELENKAPGTFHHSLQVANLAETAANAVGANTLLTRVGALYHDIGKIKNPVFFSENQSNYNPHDNLEPVESKDIIIEHVKNGVLLAKKFNLPERIIDFIKSHHGTTTVLYFFHKQSLINKNVIIETFKYPGPKPHSKETSIVMIADGVEAASKSLKSPNLENIKQLVDKVTSRLMEENQFIDATITLKDIQIVKKVITDKLVSSFQLRVEYPENNENKSNMLK
jgi:putative nucleotidyltransferase with HDIG domain